MNIFLNNRPRVALAFARAYACFSAANLPVPSDDQAERIFRLLDQPMYVPDPLDPQTDTLAYVPLPSGGFYVPSWARAGVRYLRPGIDILSLDPADWYTKWWDCYETILPDIDQNSRLHEDFVARFESLSAREDDITNAISTGNVLIDPARIRRALGG